MASVTVEGKSINYEAVAGSLVFKNAQDTPIISMSYTAYFKRDDDPTQRPLTFIYNGGPGSSNHLVAHGCMGTATCLSCTILPEQKRPTKL